MIQRVQFLATDDNGPEQENRNRVGREMFRETSDREISNALISAASSPGVANEVRAIFRGQSVRPMSRAGPLFTPPRPRDNNTDVNIRGPRFHRTVILLPYDSSETVPRGAFRDSLITANLEANIQFRIGMDADAVRRRIVSTFQELGHLENVR